MKKELIKTFEYRAAKSGATLWLVHDANCFLLQWKGDVQLEERIEILYFLLKEIATRKVTRAIMRARSVGTPREDHEWWVREIYLNKIEEAGLKKLAIVMPVSVALQMALPETITKMRNEKPSPEFGLEINYAKNATEALHWIKSNHNSFTL